MKGLLYWSDLDQQLGVVSMYSCAYFTLIIFLRGLTVSFQATDEQPRCCAPPPSESGIGTSVNSSSLGNSDAIASKARSRSGTVACCSKYNS